MLLIAVEPPREVIPSAHIDSDDIDDQSVPFPMANRIAIECRIRILGMRASVDRYDAEVIIQLVQLYQLSSGLHQLHRIRVRYKHPWNAARETIHRGPKQLKIHTGHSL